LSVGLHADLERRFGGLRRLYGDDGYARLREASVAVVGLGGVGSWAVEALARCGVARLVLIDLDHVAESNINRQVQALASTLGQHKGLALQDRIALIHPGCEVLVVDDFAGPDNWPALLPQQVQAVVEACDQVRAKAAIAAWALREQVPLVCVGAAGGKKQAHRVEVLDLAETTHDPLLASLRQRLRKEAGAPPPGRKIGVRCVFSRESVTAPVTAPGCELDGSLNCHGYGSSVAVTATFGMVAAGEAIEQLIAARPRAAAAEPAKLLDIM
jgi:tRNA A37 threonylcarbamoyladenosine dehydratase